MTRCNNEKSSLFQQQIQLPTFSELGWNIRGVLGAPGGVGASALVLCSALPRPSTVSVASALVSRSVGVRSRGEPITEKQAEGELVRAKGRRPSPPPPQQQLLLALEGSG